MLTGTARVVLAGTCAGSWLPESIHGYPWSLLTTEPEASWTRKKNIPACMSRNTHVPLTGFLLLSATILRAEKNASGVIRPETEEW